MRALRTLAGFTAEASQFYLSHVAVIPPPELRRKVFNWIDAWRQRLDNGDVEQSSFAADGFLKLLEQLRVVLLQDSVLMRERFPYHCLWQDSLFQDELYLEFECELNPALENEVEPADLLLQRAVPVLENKASVLQQLLNLLN
ncbi:hypothetical protein BDA99DRAFT_531686 [Phascolomyces articulosus]|uniref:Ndc10 domain-containing protein n=1 Tax=Phascolomyces articulosus TaxID=60185 RepID=A0AAD5KD50_9FUNG|nr:hypothetical protein BDA99DRAFT_531686 [Phascolomyces articulosus]